VIFAHSMWKDSTLRGSLQIDGSIHFKGSDGKVEKLDSPKSFSLYMVKTFNKAKARKSSGGWLDLGYICPDNLDLKVEISRKGDLNLISLNELRIFSSRNFLIL